MEQALKLWGLGQFDLIHVHNLVDWKSHLHWLQRWKDEGRVRYLGITTSHGRRHGETAEIIQNQPFDFVQFTYNLADREAEQRLLPLAQQQGKAVVINRPFRGGDLFRQVAGRPLARLGSGNRLPQLGTVFPVLGDLPSGRDLRYSGHLQPGAPAGEHGRVAITAAHGGAAEPDAGLVPEKGMRRGAKWVLTRL
jgi:hypothetical protein